MHHSKMSRAHRARRRSSPLHSAGKATLADVAAIAGVSQMTVSRVVNDGPVSEKTRQIVEQALERLDYRPNQAAQALAASRKTQGSGASDRGGAAAAPFPDLWAPCGKFIADMWKPRSPTEH